VQDALRAATQTILGSMQAMRGQAQDQAGGGGAGSSGSRDAGKEALPEAAMLFSEDWGNLPGTVKNQILQAMGEGYPKEFEQLIQIYFRGLAETSAEDEQ
jgi:hypothetical protein